MESRRIYFHNLDVVRFIAAIGVVLAHGFEAWKGYFVIFRNTAEYSERLFSGNFLYLERFMSNLSMGVEVFFFISGFLITYILLAEKKQAGKISIGKFYMRRAFRIWPLYYLLLALSPMLVNWLQTTPSPDYISHLFFVGNYGIISSEIWTYPLSHFWSIAIEEQFYLVWPLIIAFIPIKYLKHAFTLIVLASIVFRWWVINNEPNSWHIYLNTLSRMDTLVIGSAIGLYHFWRPIKLKFHWSILILLSAALVWLMTFWEFADYTSPAKALFKKYLYMIVYGTLIIYFVIKKPPEKIRPFKKMIVYFGKISYGIYLYHNIFLLILIKKILLNNRLDSWPLFWVTYVCGTLLLSVISFELIEKWFLRFKERFSVVKTRKF